MCVCVCVCVGECVGRSVPALHAHTYVFPSVSVCVFLGETKGLEFLQEECLLKVFTADSYFIRRVGCKCQGAPLG